MSSSLPTKVCRGCHVEKPITDYYTHPQMGDGRLNYCKTCKAKDSRDYYARNIDACRAYNRARGNLPHRVAARQAYAQTDAYKISSLRTRKRYIANNPHKRDAVNAVNNAVRDGRLIKAPCVICGSVRRIHGHHDNYERPLDVVWLCPPHHAERHKSLRWGK